MAELTGHTLAVTIDGDVRLAVVCHNTEGSDCRLTCDNDGCGDGETCDDWGQACHLSDSGECQPSLYLNEDPTTIAEWHNDPAEPLADGMPIVCTWDGSDGYEWRGVDTVITVVTGPAAMAGREVADVR